MKVIKTLRVDDEKTVRYYFCEACKNRVDTMELPNSELENNYVRKLEPKKDGKK